MRVYGLPRTAVAVEMTKKDGIVKWQFTWMVQIIVVREMVLRVKLSSDTIGCARALAANGFILAKDQPTPSHDLTRTRDAENPPKHPNIHN